MFAARPVSLVALAAVLACSQESPSPSAAANDAVLRAGVDSASDRLLNALRNNSSDSLLAMMSEDVVIMPPNEAVLKGKPAVKTWYDQFLTQLRTTTLTITSREVLIGGEYATEIAGFEWTLTPPAGGTPLVDRGNYIQVWHHEPDGRWLFSRELWNSSVPPAPAKAQ